MRAFLSSSASALTIKQPIDLWHPTFTPQISFMREILLGASSDHSLSLRPFGLLATLADQIRS